MHLKDYLKAERGRASALCKTLGVHEPDMSRWANGQIKVPVRFCVAIEEATNGIVSRKELRPKEYMQLWPDLDPFRITEK